MSEARFGKIVPSFFKGVHNFSSLLKQVQSSVVIWSGFNLWIFFMIPSQQSDWCSFNNCIWNVNQAFVVAVRFTLKKKALASLYLKSDGKMKVVC